MKIRFCNYQPIHKSLQVLVDKVNIDDIGNLTGSGLDAIRKELSKYNKGDINLIPKKPNHDLKRRIVPKLMILRKRTNRIFIAYLSKKLQTDN